MDSFKDQTVIVTGGSKGIGREICLQFARKKANVVINYFSSEEKAIELLSYIENFGGKAIIVKGDVSVLSDTKKIVDSAIKAFGKVDILVNNSGITRDNLMMRMSEEEFDSVINTNLKGTWNMCKSVTRHMLKNRIGKIINITSVVGIIGNAGQANYVASKAELLDLQSLYQKNLELEE